MVWNYVAANLKSSGFIQRIQLDDTNYLKGLETIYNYPDQFIGKTIEMNGFIYKDADTGSSFLFRFGIIHCVADSGVFGMLIDMPDDVTLENDDWVHLEGELSTIFYQPFKTKVPYLKIKNWSTIDPPDDEYVYRNS